MRNKFEHFCEKFYGLEADFAGKLSRVFKPARVSSWTWKHLNKPVSLLSIELFVAVSLAIYYFFIMLSGCSGTYVENDNTFSNTQLFTYRLHHPISTNVWFLNASAEWRGRLPGPVITGWLTDIVAQKNCCWWQRRWN